MKEEEEEDAAGVVVVVVVVVMSVIEEERDGEGGRGRGGCRRCSPVSSTPRHRNTNARLWCTKAVHVIRPTSLNSTRGK